MGHEQRSQTSMLCSTVAPLLLLVSQFATHLLAAVANA
jgi:hypothetical protein